MRSKGKYAQHFHITPERGLLNDPNGLCFFDGYYHVFFQLNPLETDHSTKHWGHLRTKDLKHWETLPNPLKPDTWFDKDGVYSGSAIVYKNKLCLFYTGNTKDLNGVRTSYQCLATSDDGVNFIKHGPILEQPPGYTGHVRDPKVWFDEQLQGWWLLLGAQREDKTGDTLVYFSEDLLTWEFKNSILTLENPLGFMWECPDLLFMEDEVTKEQKAIFIFSPQGLEPQGNAYQNIFNTVYSVGKWDNQGAKFIPDIPLTEQLLEVDNGFEFYAPQAFVAPDGRIIQYAWMGTMWPEVEAALPTHKDDWAHQLSMPRTLHLVNGRLIQRPIKELMAAVSNTQPVVEWQQSSEEVQLYGPSHIELRGEKEMLCDFTMTIDKELVITYNSQNLTLSLERINWLTKEREVRQTVLNQLLKRVDIWLDTSSIELFANQGETVFSSRYFATSPNSHIQLSSETLNQTCLLKVSHVTGYTFD